MYTLCDTQGISATLYTLQVVVPGDHVDCILLNHIAQQALEPARRFMDVAEDIKGPMSPAETALSTAEALDVGLVEKKIVLPGDDDRGSTQSCRTWAFLPRASMNGNRKDDQQPWDARWYEYDLHWSEVVPNFPWAASFGTAAKVWATACFVPDMKIELLQALLTVETVLLWHHQPPATALEAPPLSSYRSFGRKGGDAGRHLDAWLYFALLKVVSGDGVSASEVRKHFERSWDSGLSFCGVGSQLAEGACGRIVGCYELNAVRFAGLASVEAPLLTGRLVYTELGLMAACVRLNLSGAFNTSICYSGHWSVIGAETDAHVLHQAYCNLHAGLVDAVVDLAARPDNYGSTRVRALRLSNNAQTLTLTTAGVELVWCRAPERGWFHQIEAVPMVSVDALYAKLVQSAMQGASTWESSELGATQTAPTNQAIARGMYGANLVMHALAASFVEPAELSETAMGLLARGAAEGSTPISAGLTTVMQPSTPHSPDPQSTQWWPLRLLRQRRQLRQRRRLQSELLVAEGKRKEDATHAVAVKEARNKRNMSLFGAVKKTVGAKPRAPAAGAEMAAASAFQSTAVFNRIAANLKSDPGLLSEVGGVFHFNITGGPGGSLAQWAVDAKMTGEVKPEAPPKADCVITIGDADMVALMTGELQGAHAFMSGKMKIKGNMMLAQKFGALARESAKSKLLTS